MYLKIAGAVLPAIVKALRTLKATEDATSEPATQNMYLLCDTALALAKAIVDVHSPGTATTGKYPGSIPLPKTFFRQLDLRQLTSKCPGHLQGWREPLSREDGLTCTFISGILSFPDSLAL